MPLDSTGPQSTSVGQISAAFQQHWKAGRRPRIEEFLDTRLSAERLSLLRELLVVEFQCRAQTSQLTTDVLADLQARLPEHQDLIQAIYDQWSSLSDESSADTEVQDFSPAADQAAPRENDNSSKDLDQIGRYRTIRVLGTGAYGKVYLAHDPDLERRVALKVPRRDRFSGDSAIERFLAEARLAANLKHSGIVTVHDVGREGDRVFVVLEYIEGSDLRQLLSSGQLEPLRAAQIMAEIADAVAYAHQRGLVHRDLKPANVLLDRHGRPHVADFGLAISEGSQRSHNREIAGTPRYMAPEQVRGETHRLDGRTDIWALGAVLYEMLTQRRAFQENKVRDLFEEIESRDPRPPRQVIPTISRELERICLKCLSKRMTDRYSTAIDLAEELRLWARSVAEGSTSQKTDLAMSIPATMDGATTAHTDTETDEATEARIVPKGLRAFDADDVDFFLRLLPGPRDRNGLPESIRFWKQRIEQRDTDETFAVGLLYGPSGCGKSSLIRAGLIPHLAQHVMPIYLDATPDDTESHLLQRLRKHLPRLPDECSLADTLAEIRDGDYLPADRKLLIVLDQFEQWLYPRPCEFPRELIDALRQCDGGRVQTLIMVRDDFWMAVSRFFVTLEIDIVPHQNSALVDLFDTRHAQHVLTEFGRAFGRLPAESNRITPGQVAFVDGAVRELAQDGKVISVNLALLAEMVKGKDWTPATLRDMRGAGGVGLIFLEETFSSKTANPTHRVHQKAARRVLSALLPDSDTDIRGHMRSVGELAATAGYAVKSREFKTLIRMLDRELRLITPTDPAGLLDGLETDSSSFSVDDRYFQLTHDFLVPALRQWLTRKQRETRSGRAELRLTERAQLWSGNRESKQLPTLAETVQIATLTDRRRWTDIQRVMMRRASRFHTARVLVVAILALSLAGWSISQARARRQEVRQNYARGLLDLLYTAKTERIGDVIRELQDYHSACSESLWDRFKNINASSDDRLRAALALLDGVSRAERGPLLEAIIGGAMEADSLTMQLVRQQLASHQDVAIARLWPFALDESSPSPARLRAAVLLASFDANNPRWASLAATVTSAILSEDPLEVDHWAELLQPAAEPLLPSLRQVFSNPSATQSDRLTATRILSQYADGDVLVELILEADASQYSLLIRKALASRASLLPVLSDVIAAKSTVDSQPPRAERQRNAAITLLRLNCAEPVWPLLGEVADPTVRTMLILQAHEFGVSIDTLLTGWQSNDDVRVRQAILLALEPYRSQLRGAAQKQSVIDLCTGILQKSPRQAERSAARWLLTQWDPEASIDKRSTSTPQDDWLTTNHGHALAIVNAPVSFRMGSPDGEAGREGIEYLKNRTIERSFAISCHEVTIGQFLESSLPVEFALDVSVEDPRDLSGRVDGVRPMNRISWLDALRYCRWLGEREGLAEAEQCYPPLAQITPEMILPDDFLDRSGYRLPTEIEWEYACRAGSETPWFCGDREEHLPYFARFAVNGEERLWPVGSLRPNPLGLFDIVGNVGEWCHNSPVADLYEGLGLGVPIEWSRSPVRKIPQAFRGLGYYHTAKRLRSAQRYHVSVLSQHSFRGFRIARTIHKEP